MGVYVDCFSVDRVGGRVVYRPGLLVAGSKHRLAPLAFICHLYITTDISIPLPITSKQQLPVQVLGHGPGQRRARQALRPAAVRPQVKIIQTRDAYVFGFSVCIYM